MPGTAELSRIEEALGRAAELLAGFDAARVERRMKTPGDPVTEADLAVNELLLGLLPRPGEGWLSEETADDGARLEHARVWVVDPLDGTREFLAGIDEWSVSIGLVEDGRAVAGGVVNPAAARTVIGAVGQGVFLDGAPCAPTATRSLDGAEILASRSEVGRGEWAVHDGAGFRFRPTGSVANKLALVAAGLADGTWTLQPKHEWDVAGGVALLRAAGGAVWIPGGGEPSFNRRDPLLPGLVAVAPGLAEPVRAYLAGLD